VLGVYLSVYVYKCPLLMVLHLAADSEEAVDVDVGVAVTVETPSFIIPACC